MSTLEQVLREGTERLQKASIEESALDAWYLMEYYFSITRARYYMECKKEISEKQYKEYLSLIDQRATRLPLQHITHVREFYGLEFYVNEHVLIPRQETEVLVEEALRYAEGKKVLDICTGSGCIILSIAKNATLKKAVAVDISSEALKVANRNMQQLGCQVEFICSDLLEKVTGKYDVIVSNPPYITSAEIKTLEPEVRLHEPMLALDGTEDGLEFYRRITKEAGSYLEEGGHLLYEIGYDQGEAVATLMKQAGFEEVKVIQDLTGRDRVVTGRYR